MVFKDIYMLKRKMKNKKAALEKFAKILLWIVLFAILVAGVYFLLKFLTSM